MPTRSLSSSEAKGLGMLINRRVGCTYQSRTTDTAVAIYRFEAADICIAGYPYLLLEIE